MIFFVIFTVLFSCICAVLCTFSVYFCVNIFMLRVASVRGGGGFCYLAVQGRVFGTEVPQWVLGKARVGTKYIRS